MARIHEAADRAAKGVRDPEEMRRACESMDHIRMRYSAVTEFWIMERLLSANFVTSEARP